MHPDLSPAPRPGVLPERPLLDPASAAAYAVPGFDMARLVAENQRLRALVVETATAYEQLLHDLASLLMHASLDGRVSVVLVGRAAAGVPLPWCPTPGCLNFDRQHNAPNGCVRHGTSGVPDRHDRPGRGDGE